MRKLFTYIAITGNFIYILWITHNGINEGFNASRLMIASYIGIILLLLLNILLLQERKNNK